MAHQRATLSTLPTSLIEELRYMLAMHAADDSQRTAKPEMIRALRTALDARRHRIFISESYVGAVKWMSVDSPYYCRDFELPEGQLGSSETPDQQDITQGRVTLAAHATASGA
jgi:hypothetical protein